MVKGLDIFREHFRQFEGFFTLIGGAACVEWFDAEQMEFRATDDLDLVLMIEVLNQDFITAIRTFVKEGEYEIRERSGGAPILYRFAKPAREDFPVKLEFCSRSPEGFELADGQEAIPVIVEPGHHSLSAILLDNAYYELIQAHHDERDGLWVANINSLIPLKAYAWLRLTTARDEGNAVDAKNINKHRGDVFRLAATLPLTPGPVLHPSIAADLASFLAAFPEGSPEWPDILKSIKATVGTTLPPSTLRNAIRTYFGVMRDDGKL
ncbi:MAG: hypothetical protein ACOYMS_12805 [Terrimicrobiaceae bacterium]